MGEVQTQAKNRRGNITGRFRNKSPLLAPLVLAAAVAISSIPAPVFASPTSYELRKQSLREKGFGKAAEELERRVNLKDEDGKEKMKMKLTPKSASRIASHLLRLLPQMENARKLLANKENPMPRSTVELVRAVAERNVPIKDAERIAEFLLKFTKLMRFGNLKQLDENHSHVIGRDWCQIDYSGTRYTCQQQKNGWPGVPSFKKAEYICRYFKAVSNKPYFRRIHRQARSFPRRELHQYCRK